MTFHIASLLFLVAMLTVAFLAVRLATKVLWRLIAWTVLIALGAAFWALTGGRA